MSVSNEDQCAWCRGPLADTRKRFCSTTCRKRHHSRRQYGDADGYGAVLAARCCIRCGQPVPNDASQGSALRKLCRDCTLAGYRSKSNRRRQKIKENGQIPYSREEIFERDGWTCQICGEQVDRSAKYPDPLTASIDHIVPVAEDGPDVRDNVQTTHLICNWSKGGNDSQRLFGPAANRWTGSYRGD